MSKPTREQRLAQAETTARQELATQRRALAVIQSQRRGEAKKSRDRRRYQCGTLVDEAGLAGVEDAVLRPLLGLLASVASVPDPVALLEALLADGCGSPGRSVDGFACQDGSVSAAH